MKDTIDEAVKSFCEDWGIDYSSIQSHQFRVWEKDGKYYATPSNIAEPDARPVEVRIEPGVFEWEEA